MKVISSQSIDKTPHFYKVWSQAGKKSVHFQRARSNSILLVLVGIHGSSWTVVSTRRCHRSHTRRLMTMLLELFLKRSISRWSEVDWLARCYDSTLCNFIVATSYIGTSWGLQFLNWQMKSRTTSFQSSQSSAKTLLQFLSKESNPAVLVYVVDCSTSLSKGNHPSYLKVFW